jgi:hypothetical protein
MPDQIFRRFILATLATLFLLPAAARATGEATEAASIRTLISTIYDKPEARVQTDPVVVIGDHAVADWIQGERGGRALMRREQGKWQVVMCAGEGLRHADTLQQGGVPATTAKQMAKKLAQAEKPLASSLRKQFDLFGSTSDPINKEHAGHPAHALDHPAAQKH